jgi:hypothetical protein
MGYMVTDMKTLASALASGSSLDLEIAASHLESDGESILEELNRMPVGDCYRAAYESHLRMATTLHAIGQHLLGALDSGHGSLVADGLADLQAESDVAAAEMAKVRCG